VRKRWYSRRSSAYSHAPAARRSTLPLVSLDGLTSAMRIVAVLYLYHIWLK
jgi:hypothetical protein